MQAQARHNLIRGSLLAAALGFASHSFAAVQLRGVQHTNQLDSPFGHTNQESGTLWHWSMGPQDGDGLIVQVPPITGEPADAWVKHRRVWSRDPVEHGNSPAFDPFRSAGAFQSAPMADPADLTLDHLDDPADPALHPAAGLTPGAIPTPGALPMLALAAIALARRRRLRPVL